MPDKTTEAVYEKDANYMTVFGADRIRVSGEVGEVLIGDVNGDNVVDSKDMTVLAKHVAKISYITNANLLVNADVNKDGYVDSEDMTKLAKYVAKIIASL